MTFDREIETFIRDYVKDLSENNAAIFAGAGLSRQAGYVNWPELLSEIAEELGLSVDREHDLISLAQYHVNEKGGKAKITRKILEEFATAAEPTINHKILARLPISTFWTTNYDTLIEDALKEALKIADVKHQVKQLANTRPKRDAVVYKMHGDVHHPSDATLTKEQYQAYYKSHEAFITALSGDLISKTFLFIGFSFTDPNLDYVLGRLAGQFGRDSRQHYCFIKRHKLGEKGNEDQATFEYNSRKQQLMIGDLKRYHIQALLIDEYEEITTILQEIENRFKKKTVFISGSAEEYGQWNRTEAQVFIHKLSKAIIQGGFRVVNGFGWGIGSAVINGALEAVYERPDRYSEDQLIIKPFPQFETGSKPLAEMWEEYRQRMIVHAGIAIFVFGNKTDKDGKAVLAGGVRREFEISIEKGLIPIPVAATGYVAQQIYEEIVAQSERYYRNLEWILKGLPGEGDTPEQIVEKVVKIITQINRR